VYFKILIDKFLTTLLAFLSLVKDMQRIELFVFGINSVGSKAAAKSVGALVHQSDGANDVLAIPAPAVFLKDGRDRAA